MIECHARLALGTCTVLQIVGPANRVNIKGHVLRCEVISVAPANGLLYRVAIAFEGMSRALLKLGGGSGEILRDVRY